jgi:hypothetical protein
MINRQVINPKPHLKLIVNNLISLQLFSMGEGARD